MRSEYRASHRRDWKGQQGSVQEAEAKVRRGEESVVGQSAPVCQPHPYLGALFHPASVYLTASPPLAWELLKDQDQTLFLHPQDPVRAGEKGCGVGVRRAACEEHLLRPSTAGGAWVTQGTECTPEQHGPQAPGLLPGCSWPLPTTSPAFPLFTFRRGEHPTFSGVRHSRNNLTASITGHTALLNLSYQNNYVTLLLRIVPCFSTSHWLKS